MNDPKVSVQESLERIAVALEMIALFLQVFAEDQGPQEESSTEPGIVMTQSGPMKLS